MASACIIASSKPDLSSRCSLGSAPQPFTRCPGFFIRNPGLPTAPAAAFFFFAMAPFSHNQLPNESRNFTRDTRGPELTPIFLLQSLPLQHIIAKPFAMGGTGAQVSNLLCQDYATCQETDFYYAPNPLSPMERADAGYLRCVLQRDR
jgi:hypothetical protein